MFQLQIADSDVTNGTIAVSWCLDHEVINDLAKKKIVDPQVVICVAPEDNYHITKEYRKIVPLKDLMTYIEFRSPGKNKIWGFISLDKGGKKARSHYLDKSDGEFSSNILNYDGDNYSSSLLNTEEWEAQDEKKYFALSLPISVGVPKAVFAPEPPKWEKTWVNHLFRDKVVDQCEFRRRRIFAYTAQPFILLASLLARTAIILFGMLTLAKNISFQYLLHPLMYSLKDTIDIFEKGSLAVRHLPEDDVPMEKWPKPGYFFRSSYLVPLMPLIWVPLVYLLGTHRYIIAGMLAGILLGVLLFFVIIGFLTHHVKLLAKPFTWTWQKLNGLLETDELWYMDLHEVEIITCNSDRKPLTFDNLPDHRKTYRLKFQNIKSKVCKPFSL